MEYDVVSHDGPPYTTCDFWDDLEAVLLSEEGDAVTVELLRDGAHVPGAWVHEVFLAIERAILALDHPEVPDHVRLVAHGELVDGVTEAVPAVAHAVGCVGEARACFRAEFFGVGLVVEHSDVVGCEPLTDEHLTPSIWVILLAVGVDDDVLRV